MNDFLNSREYYGSLHLSAADRLFYGKVEGISDLIQFQGESVSELECNFIAAVADYLETCKRLNRKPDKTYKGSFNVRVSSETHKSAVLLAAKHGIKLNDVVRRALDYVLCNEHILAE